MIIKTIIKKVSDINVIIRTSHRPKYFQSCVECVRRHMPNAAITVISDTKEDYWYIEKHAPEANYYLLDKNQVEKKAKQGRYVGRFFVSNYYFNYVIPSLNGWCLIVDDDNEMINSFVTPKDEKDIYIYKTEIMGVIIPRQTHFIKFKDIDSACILFHSKEFINWKPQKGGDYLFIQAMAKKLKVTHREEILVRCQDKPHRGRLIDKS